METLAHQLQETRILIDHELKKYITNGQPLLKDLHESINYSLFSGGKRIRPLFCFIVGDLLNAPRRKLISLACAVEMIHTASLIMDDLPHMDDAKMRRGKPANHLVFGQDVAALASIGLLTKAYEIVLKDPELSDEKKTKVVAKLAATVGTEGLVGGQFVDLHYSKGPKDQSALEYIHTHKTASLFITSGSAAAIIGDATEMQIRALEQYAKNLGLAFQILDDILDATGNTEEVGKTLGKDEESFVSLHGIEKSQLLINQYTQEAIDTISIFDDKNKPLIALGNLLLSRNM